MPECVGLLHAESERLAEVTTGLPTTVLSGRDWYEEELLGLRLQVSAGAFLQTNTAMCERLYELAIEEARPDAARRSCGTCTRASARSRSPWRGAPGR